jgi:hypothetical protein
LVVGGDSGQRWFSGQVRVRWTTSGEVRKSVLSARFLCLPGDSGITSEEVLGFQGWWWLFCRPGAGGFDRRLILGVRFITFCLSCQFVPSSGVVVPGLPRLTFRTGQSQMCGCCRGFSGIRWLAVQDIGRKSGLLEFGRPGWVFGRRVCEGSFSDTSKRSILSWLFYSGKTWPPTGGGI